MPTMGWARLSAGESRRSERRGAAVRGDVTEPVDGPVPAIRVSGQEVPAAVVRGRGRRWAANDHVLDGRCRAHRGLRCCTDTESDRGSERTPGGSEKTQEPLGPCRNYVLEAVVGSFAFFSFDLRQGATGKIGRRHYFGGPANSGSPVALRPPLARGMPFRLLYKNGRRFPSPRQRGHPNWRTACNHVATSEHT